MALGKSHTFFNPAEIKLLFLCKFQLDAFVPDVHGICFIVIDRNDI